MAADYPTEGKISYKWLSETINELADPAGEFNDVDLCGFVLYHLRHLGLVREDMIEFEEPQLLEKKTFLSLVHHNKELN